MPRTPVILQSEPSECGLACLSMIFASFGRAVSLADLRRATPTSFRGTTLRQMMAIATDHGLECEPYRLELDHLKGIRLPAVLHWDMRHFVVLVRASRRYAWIHDPAIGERRVPWAAISDHFTGFVMLVRPSPHFERSPGKSGAAGSGFNVSTLLTRALTMQGGIPLLIGLSLALQVLTLGLPLFSQVLIDDVILRGRHDMVASMFVVFAIVAVMSLLTMTARGLFSVSLGTTASLDLMNWIVYRLLRLPTTFFEERSTGDILTRLSPLRQIQRTLTDNVVTSLSEGLMSVVLLVIMAIYDLWSTVIVLTVVAAKLTLVRFIGRRMKVLTNEASVAASAESSLLLEAIRNIVPLRIFGLESMVHSRWGRRVFDSMHAGERAAMGNLGLMVSTEALTLLQTAAVLALGVQSVEDKTMSVGMLVAYIAFMGQLTGKVSKLESAIVDLTTTAAHVARVAEFVAEPLTSGGMTAGGGARRLPGKTESEVGLTLAQCSFRYAPHLPWLFQDLSLDIQPGETVGIVGSSGVGKTTLLNLMLGLRAPTLGEIRVDRDRITPATRHLMPYRMAVVMQGETPFAGTILDNISLFEDEPDLARVHWAAGMAALDDDIRNMQMRYDTLVGEAGVGLSAGQRQRLLIARCLYQMPQILILDEATSNLDPQTEAKIVDNLASLRMTTVIVAHREAALRRAAQVYQLTGGRLNRVR
ncbi:peptidase domain-containing ABC transporter [Niveispirillum sp. KHB5.9]|uniref:peptidase domain-containing ABC transporter n=1 Tax=Niveispirillum sp. KHB5.9 TaxID=3400269 RepID=UPI003A8B8D2D